MTENQLYISSTYKGIKRQENRDNLLIIEDFHFFIFAVFDGVSNAKGGKEGAFQARKYIEDNYNHYFENKIDIKSLMYNLNKYLVQSDINEPYSTYCLLYLDKRSEEIEYSWLGDSRIYNITNQFIEKLTEDDRLSENVITKFLGSSSLHFDDFRQKRYKKRSGHLLLCTDGFYQLFESDILKFFNVFNGKSLDKVKEKINLLIQGNNFDDSTFIFVK